MAKGKWKEKKEVCGLTFSPIHPSPCRRGLLGRRVK